MKVLFVFFRRSEVSPGNASGLARRSLLRASVVNVAVITVLLVVMRMMIAMMMKILWPERYGQWKFDHESRKVRDVRFTPPSLSKPNCQSQLPLKLGQATISCHTIPEFAGCLFSFLCAMFIKHHRLRGGFYMKGIYNSPVFLVDVEDMNLGKPWKKNTRRRTPSSWNRIGLTTWWRCCFFAGWKTAVVETSRFFNMFTHWESNDPTGPRIFFGWVGDFPPPDSAKCKLLVLGGWWCGFLLASPKMKGIGIRIGVSRYESQSTGPQTTHFGTTV